MERILAGLGSFRFVDHPHRTIRFTSTEDGVDIAFWEIGEGKPVVIIQNLSLSHAELEWTVPSIASFYTDMAERYRVIRFDPRGIGLSGEPPGGWVAVSSSGAHPGMSTHGMGLDISAVVSALEIDSFALMGVSVQSPVAIEFAATHPEVTELILCEGVASTSDSWLGPTLRTQLALGRMEDETGEAVFTVWERVAPPDEFDQLINLVRSASLLSKPGYGGDLAQLEWDAEPFLAEISIPTLILRGRDTDFVDTLPDARHLAAGIRDSQLRVVDGNWAPYFADRAAILEAIDAMLQPEEATVEPISAGFRTVVFTDIVESTEYMLRVGDEAGRTAIRELEQQIATLASGHDGRVVKNLGDGSLISFGSNSSAITFALDLQDACGDGPLRLRVGMSAGEPIQEDGDIHGTVVTQASRIGDLGDAGEVIVSDSVRQLAAGKGFTFEPRGEVSLKGFDEPERVWTVTQKRRP